MILIYSHDLPRIYIYIYNINIYSFVCILVVIYLHSQAFMVYLTFLHGSTRLQLLETASTGLVETHPAGPGVEAQTRCAHQMVECQNDIVIFSLYYLIWYIMIYYDILWYIMIYYDILWYIIYYDIILCLISDCWSWVFVDLCWFWVFMIFNDHRLMMIWPMVDVTGPCFEDSEEGT